MERLFMSEQWRYRLRTSQDTLTHAEVFLCQYGKVQMKWVRFPGVTHIHRALQCWLPGSSSRMYHLPVGRLHQDTLAAHFSLPLSFLSGDVSLSLSVPSCFASNLINVVSSPIRSVSHFVERVLARSPSNLQGHAKSQSESPAGPSSSHTTANHSTAISMRQQEEVWNAGWGRSWYEKEREANTKGGLKM